jgi:hypothetical protein
MAAGVRAAVTTAGPVVHGSWLLAFFLFPPGFPSYVFRFPPYSFLFLPLIFIFVFCCSVWSTHNYCSHEKASFAS